MEAPELNRPERGSGGTESRTLVTILREHVARKPDRRVYTFLDAEGREAASLDFGELDARARAVAARLRAEGGEGERALLLYPPGLELIVAFVGCLYAGVAAVPAYPPRPRRDQPRLRSILADCAPRWVLTTAEIAAWAGAPGALPEIAGVSWLATDTLPMEPAGGWSAPPPAPESVAFLQYTSGSTADPKGVVVTHGNLAHNEELIRQAFGQSEESVVVGWLPMYHDMGLIGTVLQPLYTGARAVLMAPLAFLQKPRRWLEAIDRYRATTSGGPSFAYDLCVRKIGEAERRGLDLSSWQVAFNGAEPVRAETLERFTRAFAPCGFRREAFHPCYGLAEATLFVTGGRPGEPPAVRRVEAAALAGHAVREVAAGDPAGRDLVSCGRPWGGQTVRIVDPETGRLAPPDGVGEIWIAGPSVAAGYWGRPAAAAAAFAARLAESGEGPFLRTGDLGFLAGSELFVTGRLKDLIILRGRNVYPQDVELTAERSHPGLRPGCGAAFAVERDAEERLVVVQEVERGNPAVAGEAGLAAAAAAIRRAVAEEHEAAVEDVVFLRSGTLPKTSSGKVRRQACRAGYLAGSLERVAGSGPGGAPAAGPGEAGSQLPPWLREEAARALRRAPGALAVAEPLTALGLDSLAAVELQQGVEARTGVTLPISRLLGGASLAELAEIAGHLERETASGPEGEVLPPGVEEPGVYPASAGQQALWYTDRLAPAAAAYNLAGAVRAAAGVDVAALRLALERLIARHTALRTTFEARGGEPVRRVHAEMRLDLAAAPAPAEDFDRALAAEAWRPFDLERGPLLRVRVWDLPAGGHTLLLAVHHLVVDFWSLSLLLGELGALYAEARGGAAASPPAPAARYADWVERQERRLAGPRGEAMLAAWRERLAGELPVLDLATDRPRPPVQTYAGRRRLFHLDAGLAGGLRRLGGAAHGSTLYMVLLAGFQAFLHRAGGQPEVLVGSPTAGRSGAGLADAVGYFVNPVVLRTGFAGDPSGIDLVARVRETALAAFEGQEMPFARLAERLAPERDPSRSPLFQAMFVLQRARTPEERSLAAFALGEAGAGLDLADLRLTSLALAESRALVDVTLTAAETGDGFTAALQVNADLFDDTTLERLAAHLGALLRGMAEEPGRPVDELPILSQAERRQLAAWNATDRDVPEAAGLHELIADQAARTPGSVAVSGGGRALTYRDLERRTARLAARLRRAGVGPETRVGVCVGRSPELVVALLAVWRAGGAYVPLDPAYPAERLAFMLEDSRAAVLVAAPDLLGRLPATGAETVLLGGGDAMEDEAAAAPPGTPAVADNLAYLIYTSGSTGRPKGVAIAHRSAVAFAAWAREGFSDAELAGVLAATSICFDLSVFELFVPLCWGGRVIVAENALALLDLPEARDVRLINTVPSAIAELVRAGGVPATVTTVVLAGEPLRGELVRALRERTAVRRVLNLYGPSEATTYATGTEPGDGEPTLGLPIANTRAHVLDAALQPVPVGTPGEICLGGAGLARGYLGRPELTAERFVPSPFAGTEGEEPGARLYRTGDLARRRPDGELAFLGRIDHQVKIRGFRVELGEIEAALLASGAVRAAAVLVREAPDGEKRLVACVVPAAELDVPALAAGLRRRLPEVMIPADFVALPALPLNASGKVDRKALAAVAPERRRGAGTAPRTPAEARLAAIWEEVLGAGSVGVEDDFVAVGGHSLLALRLQSRIRESFGVVLPLGGFFRSTIASLAASLAEERAATEEGIAPLPRDGRAFPLSFAQERLWLLDRLEPGVATYHMAGSTRLAGRLDAAALRRALGEIVRRHEALRTTFPEREGRPVQAIQGWTAPETPLLDLTALPAGRREREADRLERAEARRSFDLARGPLLRARLLRLAPGAHRLLLVLHHIVADEASLQVLGEELSALYDAFSHGLPSPLAEPRCQLADFAAWQRARLQGEALAAGLAWWSARLAGLPALELPADRPRPAARSVRGGVATASLPPAVTAALRELGRRAGSTLFMTLLAGFQALLGRYAGLTDLAVGSPVSSRDRRELERLVGFLVNTLVLRADLAGGPGFRELLGRVREATLAAHEHGEVPFELLVERLHPERALGRNPLFDVSFALEDPPADRRAGDLELATSTLATGTAKFDLALFAAETAAETAAGVGFSLEYATDLFDPPSARRLLGHLGTLLAAAAANPELPWRELPLLSPAERQALLVDSNAAAGAAVPELAIHQSFLRQAARAPQRVAVVWGTERWTYAELERRSGALARRLRRLGVRAETPVGVFSSRTPEMVAALLAVLRAGGAYLPLDPAYPPARLAFLLADGGGVPLVLAEPGRAADLPPFAGEVALLGGGEIADGGRDEPVPVDPEQIAYFIYTSGSTGTPKGIAIRHGSAAARVAWSLETYPRERFAGVLAATSICFDMSVFELFATLAAGGTVILADDALALPTLPAAAAGEVTLINTVPSAAAELVRAGGIPASVRTVNLGGEPVRRELAAALYALPQVEAVYNLYGPSEDTTYSTVSRLAREGAPDIGRPLAHSRALVLDGDLALLPAGAFGELWLGGAGLARGYRGRPELTADRFRPDPFGAPGDRLYRTGDRVRRRPGGELELAGRFDHQVKVRGYRVEPGEIEAVLAAQAGVAEAAVVARDDLPGGRGLAAFVVAGDAPLDLDALRDELRWRLPAPFQPAVFVPLPALPLHPNGKVDRLALARAPILAAGGERWEATAPRTPVEEIVAAIWSDLLGGAAVGVHDDFFDLGGHSLLAAQVVSRLRTPFGVELPLRTLWEEPTVARLAARIEAARRGGAAGPPPVVPVDRGAPLPLSFAQERLWFLDQLEPASPVYNLPAAVRLDGGLDPAALAAAVAGIVERHEALRTRFGREGGQPVQRVAPSLEVPLVTVDLAGLAPQRRSAEALRLAREEALQPFALDGGPLVRATLLRHGAERHDFLVTLHHIVSDGWSLGLFQSELAALYATAVSGEGGEPAALPALPVQYADYAVWQRRWRAGAALEADLAFWRQRLAGIPRSLELPGDRPRPVVQSFRGASRRLAFDAPLSAALRGFGRQRGGRRSWSSSPSSRPCCGATAARATSSSAPRSPTAAGWSSSR